MAGSATEESITLKIWVDEEKNRVVFAQAGKDFVDVLLSFLTLPLGTIARLVAKESNIEKVSVGSLVSLYESVANLEVKQFWTEACKEMLLQPRNSMQDYCRRVKLNIDDTENIKYFICDSINCISLSYLLSTFKNTSCDCGDSMYREIYPAIGESIISIFIEGFVPDTKGFVPDIATFIISDDLNVMPDNFQTTVSLPMNLGYENFDSIKLLTVNVTQKEILDLLKGSLLSQTPLTDLFFRKKQFSLNAQPNISGLVLDIGEPEGDVVGEMIEVKVVLRKSQRKILFAMAEEDFVDFLFSFLTFPLGKVEQMLEGNSCLGCIDNLYNSVVNLDDDRYLRSTNLKDKLVNSRLAYQFKLRKQILPIDEMPVSIYSFYDVPLNKPCYVEPQSSTGDIYSSSGGRGFVKKASLYMVTDDLVVTPGSSSSVITFLKESRIPPSDCEERLITIGQKEGLSLLKASLTSSSSLTNGLIQFIKPIKEENITHG